LKFYTLNFTPSDSCAFLLSLVAISGSWDDVFKVSVGLYLVGTVVWNLFSTGEKILD
jgi:ACS family sodium-dependent inorganic phosphate cotransporter